MQNLYAFYIKTRYTFPRSMQYRVPCPRSTTFRSGSYSETRLAKASNMRPFQPTAGALYKPSRSLKSVKSPLSTQAESAAPPTAALAPLRAARSMLAGDTRRTAARFPWTPSLPPGPAGQQKRGGRGFMRTKMRRQKAKISLLTIWKIMIH